MLQRIGQEISFPIRHCGTHSSCRLSKQTMEAKDTALSNEVRQAQRTASTAVRLAAASITISAGLLFSLLYIYVAVLAPSTAAGYGQEASQRLNEGGSAGGARFVEKVNSTRSLFCCKC